MKKDTYATVAAELFSEHEGETIIISASLDRLKAVKPKILHAQLVEQGFVRAYQNGKIIRLEEAKEKDIHSLEIIVDRVKVNEDSRARLIDGLKSAFKLGRGEVQINFTDSRSIYSERMECRTCGEKVKAPNAALFNWNHPSGSMFYVPRIRYGGRH